MNKTDVLRGLEEAIFNFKKIHMGHLLLVIVNYSTGQFLQSAQHAWMRRLPRTAGPQTVAPIHGVDVHVDPKQEEAFRIVTR